MNKCIWEQGEMKYFNNKVKKYSELNVDCIENIEKYFIDGLKVLKKSIKTNISTCIDYKMITVNLMDDNDIIKYINYMYKDMYIEYVTTGKMLLNEVYTCLLKVLDESKIKHRIKLLGDGESIRIDML